MPRHFVLFLLLALGAVSSSVAQSNMLNLPRASQHAVLTQRIGITDITINYHRPTVNGRKVWGGLVPYGQVWRAGANENTTIQFTDPVTVEGKPLDRGTYGLHMIPGENDFTVILSKNYTSWGSFTYKESEDALRVTVKPQATEFHEALTYDFDEVKPDAAVVTMRWEKLAIPLRVGVDTNHVVAENLHKQLRGLAQYTWDGWDDAANYLLANKVDLDDALKYSDQSVQVEQRYENLMTKSQVLAAMGKKDESASAKRQALEMANALQLHGYGRQLQAEKKQDEAFEVFRMNIKKNPNSWISHNEQARMLCANGDYDKAVSEMKQASAGAPDAFKSQVDGLVKRLEAKDDINK